LLADKLHTALRDGLAHGFDTKHLHVDGETVQIYISWGNKELIGIQSVSGGLRLYIGIQPFAEALCAKINDFEDTLQRDEAARKQFKRACEYHRLATLNRHEAAAWRRLIATAEH
jgi:hypothetical protein